MIYYHFVFVIYTSPFTLFQRYDLVSAFRLIFGKTNTWMTSLYSKKSGVIQKITFILQQKRILQVSNCIFQTN